MAGGGYKGFSSLPRSNSGLLAPTSARSPTSQNSPAVSDQTSTTIREQDRFMPIANVIRIMRRVLPPHAKIADEAKETIQECVSEYISFITSEANERCQREQRKTITAEDVIWAMSKLGFDNYIEPLSLYLQRYRESEGDTRGSIRGDPFPIRRAPLAPDQGMVFFGQSMGLPQMASMPPLPMMAPFHGAPSGGPPAIYGDGMGGFFLGTYNGGGADSDRSAASSSSSYMSNNDHYGHGSYR